MMLFEVSCVNANTEDLYLCTILNFSMSIMRTI